MSVQDELLALSKKQDLSRIPLRKIAERIGRGGMSPGNLQHHFVQLEKRGLLFVDRKAKTQRHGTRHLDVQVLPDGREIAYIPFKNWKIVDVDGCAAVIAVEGDEL